MKNTSAIILAAGEGKRMRSKLPKVLHPVCGLPMIAHVVRVASQAKISSIVVVVSSQGTRVREYLKAKFPNINLKFALQSEQLGTAHALQCGLKGLKQKTGRIVILSGDTP